MIIDYLKDGSQVTDYLKVSLNDRVYVRKDGDKPRRFFSVNPFVFVFDYARMQNVGFLKLFNAERFTGSKVLYCIFLSDTYNEDCLNYAIRVAKQKHLVLFGCECLTNRITLQTQTQLGKITDKVIGYCPFERKNGVTFPICR